MAEQPKAGDVGAGLAAVGVQQIHQGRLALLHLGQGLINPGGLAVLAWSGGHGGSKQHPCADGFDQHQDIA